MNSQGAHMPVPKWDSPVSCASMLTVTASIAAGLPGLPAHNAHVHLTTTTSIRIAKTGNLQPECPMGAGFRVEGVLATR